MFVVLREIKKIIILARLLDIIIKLYTTHQAKKNKKILYIDFYFENRT